MKRVLYTCNPTGTKMSQLGKVKDQIKEGDVLAVICRPDNSYDSQAISLHYGGSLLDPQVGWVPAKEIEDKIVKGVLFRLMQYGFPLQARVVQYEAEQKFLRVDIELAGGEADDDGDGLEPEYDEDDIPGSGDED